MEEKMPVKRVVPMEVLVLGVSRTGTSSTREALKILGFRDVYDYDYMTWHYGHADLWSKAIRAKWEDGPPMTEDDWNTLLGRCRAIIVLNVRDNADVWWKSFSATIYRNVSQHYKNPSLLTRYIHHVNPMPEWQKWDNLNRLMVKYGATQGKHYYDEHNERVKKEVPNDRLLVWNVKQGWGPFCKHLERDIPDQDFPHVYETKDYQDKAQYVWRLLYWMAFWHTFWTGVSFCGMGAILHWLAGLFRRIIGV
ncbi:hypothetical protein IWX90DRAFT_487810 [Phyllosticta citrichinensis]|uniref:P-loop containing nucleoside triphosphate hydrolase protein n=1 Tax=Phyllosticta citrichinensis TaxID=1130410 RepID=A0ABR1XS76_9PEZI